MLFAVSSLLLGSFLLTSLLALLIAAVAQVSCWVMGRTFSWDRVARALAAAFRFELPVFCLVGLPVAHAAGLYGGALLAVLATSSLGAAGFVYFLVAGEPNWCSWPTWRKWLLWPFSQ